MNEKGWVLQVLLDTLKTNEKDRNNNFACHPLIIIFIEEPEI